MAVVAISFASLIAVALSTGSPAQAQPAGTGSWFTVATANPPNSDSGGVDPVSCASTTFCVAVGQYNGADNFVSQLLEEWNGSTWSIMTPPVEASNGDIENVSCVSTTFCMAVGEQVEAGSCDQTFSEEWNGTSWGTITTTNPVPCNTNPLCTQINCIALDNLGAVSCTSPTFCVATGSATLQEEYTIPVAEEWNGSTWSTMTTTGPNPTNSSLNAVSCTSPTFCMGVGNDGSATFGDEWNGSSWVLNATVASGSFASTTNLSCTSATFCIAVGATNGANGSDSFAEEWNGSSWTVMTTTDPAADNMLNGVSCASSTFCVAAGQRDNKVTPQTLAEEWNGSTWSTMTTNDPFSHDNLGDVACPSNGFCVGIGADDTPNVPIFNDSFSEIFTAQPPTSLAATPAVLRLSPLALELLNLTATMTNVFTGAPISGEAVNFTAGSTLLCTAKTNASGVASCNVLSNVAGVLAVVLSDGYSVSFVGDASYLPSNGSAGLIG